MARKIIIQLSGGNIQEIYSTEKENDAISIYVVDWDNIKNGEPEYLTEFPLTYATKLEIEEMIEGVNNYIKFNREE